MDRIPLAGILELREAGPSATGREVQSGHSLINDCPARGSLSQTPVDDEGPSWLLSLQYARTEGIRFICQGGVSQPQKQSGESVHPVLCCWDHKLPKGLREQGAGEGGPL